MQIYDILVKDHDEVRQLLAELTGMTGKGDPHELVSKIRDALIPHARAEEAVFYNSLRGYDKAKDKLMHSFKEHFEAETLLRTIQMKENIAGDWKKTAKELKTALEHHIEEEQGQIFPLAREYFSDEEAESIGRAFEKMKTEIVDEGLMKTSLELVANLMPRRFTDRFRDFRVSDRGSPDRAVS
jgi:hemerythrin-like domain-containing protein